MTENIVPELKKVLEPVEDSLIESPNIEAVASVLKANNAPFELYEDRRGRILGVIAGAEAVVFAFSAIVLKLGPAEAACLTVFTSPVTIPTAMGGLTAFLGVRKIHE